MTIGYIEEYGVAGSTVSLNGLSPAFSLAWSGTPPTPVWEASNVNRTASQQLTVNSGGYAKTTIVPWKKASHVRIVRPTVSDQHRQWTIPDANQNAQVSLKIYGTNTDSWVRGTWEIVSAAYGPPPAPAYLRLYVKQAGGPEVQIGGFNSYAYLIDLDFIVSGNTLDIKFDTVSHQATGTIPELSSLIEISTYNLTLPWITLYSSTTDSGDPPATAPTLTPTYSPSAQSVAWSSYPGDAVGITVEYGLSYPSGPVTWTALGNYAPGTLTTPSLPLGSPGRLVQFRARYYNSIGVSAWTGTSLYYVPQTAAGQQEYQRIPEILCWWVSQGRSRKDLTNPLGPSFVPQKVRVPYGDVLASLGTAPKNTIQTDVALLTTGRIRVPWVSANGHDPRLVVYLPRAGGVLLNITRANVTWSPSKANAAGY